MILIHSRTTLSTARQFFRRQDDAHATTGNQQPIRQIPVMDRQFVADVDLRRLVEKYAGVTRYRTGEWHVAFPTMAGAEFRTMLNRLKHHDLRELCAFMAATNRWGECTYAILV